MTLKVLTILGTRPEIIRLARVLPALDEAVDHRVVHTGQNYDPQLSEVFFKELNLRPPDDYLGVDTSSLGAMLGNTLIATETLIRTHRPDAVLILGDTNSSIAAIIAKRLHVTVYHMEAGNRCFDENVPEEVNRRVVDHVADFNLVYTEHARRNLLAEGIHPRRIYVTGSPLREVLTFFRPQIDASGVLGELGLVPGRYFLASIHREENVDNEVHLRLLLDSLQSLHRAHGLPVIMTTHPRTRLRIDALGGASTGDGISFLRPFGYFDYVHLQQHARCVLSDSGTISEESAMLGFPAVTVRNAIERPEAIDTGVLVLTGVDPATIQNAVELVVAQNAADQTPEVPPEYRVENCSQRVVRLILGTAKLSRVWSNLAPPANFEELT